MNEIILSKLNAVKIASRSLSMVDNTTRQNVLLTLAHALRKETPLLLQENQNDLARMEKQDPKYDRLLLTEERIDRIANDVEHVASLPFKLDKLLFEVKRPNGLIVQKRSTPLGVVAVIYESRPNVTIDVFALCFKSANACVLKGSKEAVHSNQKLTSIIQGALKEHHINEDVLYSLPPKREATRVLLNATGLVDVCIPRGSQALINFVREHAKIPCIETGAGIVHTYFDKSGDIEKARFIIFNAKTRRVSVCNALDTLIIHQDRLTDLPGLVDLLKDKNVILYADKQSHHVLSNHYPASLLHKACSDDFGQEFLSHKLAIKTVASLEDAVQHIMHHTSGHSEAILAEDEQAINAFLNQVDAAVIYVNASTAFTDGGEFGMGAEIGISTQKLHARGPMALEALTSYKWIIHGNGQVRA